MLMPAIAADMRKHPVEWANCVADSLRLLCKHWLDLKKACTKWVTRDLQQLLDMIRDDGQTPSSSLDQPMPFSRRVFAAA